MKRNIIKIKKLNINNRLSISKIISNELKDNIIDIIGNNIDIMEITINNIYDKISKEIKKSNRKEFNMLYNYLIKF